MGGVKGKPGGRRGYSREFTLAPGDKGRKITIDQVPTELLERFRAACSLAGVSMRAALLAWADQFSRRKPGTPAAPTDRRLH